MAPRRTPRKEKSPPHMEKVGVEGRRTRLTLKDTGVRDEHGLEPIPTFSSPVKPFSQPNGAAHDATNSAEDSMDIDQSTIAEPRDIRNGRISLPPRATSPRKTNLKTPPRRGSGRRSLGPLSSPSVEARNGALHRATSHPASNRPVNRLLNFSPERPRESVEFSPQRGSASQIQKPRISKGAKKGAKVFDLSMTDDYDNLETEATNGYGTSNGINEDEPALQNDDDQLMVDSTMDQEVPDDYTEIHPDETAAEESLAPPATSGALDSRSRRRGSNAPSAIDPDESQMSSLEAGKRRGRPPKKTRVFKDPMLEPDVEPVPSTSPARGRRKAPPAERDPNIQMKISKRKTSRKPSSRNASVGSTSRFVQRSATPANDSGALITRFGRQSIKPLATWRGEKAILGDRTVDALPSIERVIRVDEVVDQRRRPKRSINRSARRKAKSQLADVEEEEEEEEEEEKAPWEVDPGIMMAQVMDWNPDTNKYDEESTREEDIAYSFDAIEMRDISGADFKFAKTLTLDFFGSGMVHLPPGGAKRIKNSRKMQMVFFIFYGRVTVSLGTPATKFSIGKGGQWQVPRGNFYSITNESETNDARIFFAQGCEVLAGATEESTIA